MWLKWGKFLKKVYSENFSSIFKIEVDETEKKVKNVEWLVCVSRNADGD